MSAAERERSHLLRQVVEHRPGQREAAERLGIGVRQFKRLVHCSPGGGRAPRCTLIVCIDDATGRLTALRFVAVESTRACQETLREQVLEHGRPPAFYSDRHGIFRRGVGDAFSTNPPVGRLFRPFGGLVSRAGSPLAAAQRRRITAGEIEEVYRPPHHLTIETDDPVLTPGPVPALARRFRFPIPAPQPVPAARQRVAPSH